MTRPESLFHHGDEVMVFDEKGNYELRGRIRSIHRCDPVLYDILPNRQESLSKLIPAIPESRLRRVGRPILAYEKKPGVKPKHVLDNA